MKELEKNEQMMKQSGRGFNPVHANESSLSKTTLVIAKTRTVLKKLSKAENNGNQFSLHCKTPKIYSVKTFKSCFIFTSVIYREFIVRL